MIRAVRLIAVLLTLSLSACGEDAPPKAPPAAELTRDAIGYYCNMVLLDHQGPRAQIQLADGSSPRWFTSVRDAVAFTMLPEEPKDIAAIYVTDMAKSDWDDPRVWVRSTQARYVIGSRRMGGMGAPEVVPFADEGTARDFIKEWGGRLVDWNEIPPPYIFDEATKDQDPAPMDHQSMSQSMPGQHQGHNQ